MGAGLIGLTAEFLVPVRPAGDSLRFEMTADNGYYLLRDTLAVAVAPGPDRTPPRVLSYGARSVEGELVVVVPADQVVDASAVTAIEAVVARTDAFGATTVPLALDGGHWTGALAGVRPGEHAVRIAARDAQGNEALSDARFVTVPRPLAALPGSSWERVGDPGAAVTVPVLWAAAGADPAVLYAATAGRVVRSDDGGVTWSVTPVDRPPPAARVSVGAGGSTLLVFDRTTAFLADQTTSLLATRPVRIVRELRLFVTRDGGSTWRAVDTPLGGAEEVLLAQPAAGARWLFLHSGGRLFLSRDGRDWRDTGVALAGGAFALAHPAGPLYAGEAGAGAPGRLLRSDDEGGTWREVTPSRRFDTIAPDPVGADDLYALAADSVFHSESGGRKWAFRGRARGGTTAGLVAVDGGDGPLLIVRPGDSRPALRVSRDGGRTWESIDVDAAIDVRGDGAAPWAGCRLQVTDVVPAGGGVLYATTSPEGLGNGPLVRSDDGARTWAVVPVRDAGEANGAVAFDGRGRLWVGSGRPTADGQTMTGLLASGDGGGSWRWIPVAASSFADALDAVYVDPRREGLLLTHLRQALLLGSLQRSEDGGATWRAPTVSGTSSAGTIPGGARPGFVDDPRRHGALWAVFRDPYRSVDEGATWAVVAGVPEPGVYAGFHLGGALPFGGGDSVLVAAADRLYIGDGAGAWRDLGGPASGEDVLGLARVDDLVLATTRIGLFASADLATWQLRLTPPDIPWRRGELRVRGDRILLNTGLDLYLGRDDEIGWERISDDFPGIPWFVDGDLDPLDDRAVFAATPTGVFRHRSATTPTSVEAPPTAPPSFALTAVYPNPFNATVAIDFSLPAQERVRLRVYNAIGQFVGTLHDGPLDAGTHSLRWDGHTDAGVDAATGVYIVRLMAGANQQSRKVLVLR